MATRILPAKSGTPVIDSGHLLEFLKSRGINVDGDTVTANADGSVSVDTRATSTLDTAWDDYAPPEPAPPPPTVRETLRAQIAAATDIDELKAVLADALIPALVRDGERSRE